MSITTRSATAALLSLSLAVAGAPAASARPVDSDMPIAAKPAPVYSRPDKSMVPAAEAAAAVAALVKQNPPSAVVRIHTTPGGGFDWGDAGIGAAGGLALAMIALGGGLTVSQRRGRRARHSTA